MAWGSRYYPDRWNPYNRHDTGMYCVYRKSDGQFLGHVHCCKSEYEAKSKARIKFGCECYVSHIEE